MVKMKRNQCRIKSIIDFNGVPKGTTGTAEWDDSLKGHESWKIIWNLPKEDWTDSSGYRVKGRRKPLEDWFDEEEFDRWLEVQE
jgi:hypothetical protein